MRVRQKALLGKQKPFEINTFKGFLNFNRKGFRTTQLKKPFKQAKRVLIYGGQQFRQPIGTLPDLFRPT